MLTTIKAEEGACKLTRRGLEVPYITNTQKLEVAAVRDSGS